MKAASTPFKKKKKQSGVWLTLLPLYLFTLVFVAGPLVYMFVLSFQTRAEVWGVVNQFTLDNYKNIFQPVPEHLCGVLCWRSPARCSSAPSAILSAILWQSCPRSGKSA